MAVPEHQMLGSSWLSAQNRTEDVAVAELHKSALQQRQQLLQQRLETQQHQLKQAWTQSTSAMHEQQGSPQSQIRIGQSQIRSDPSLIAQTTPPRRKSAFTHRKGNAMTLSPGFGSGTSTAVTGRSLSKQISLTTATTGASYVAGSPGSASPHGYGQHRQHYTQQLATEKTRRRVQALQQGDMKLYASLLD
jgi:hypothetical protein